MFVDMGKPELEYRYCSVVAKLYMTLVTPWPVTHQAPLSMGSPRQEYWSGLLFPSPENLPNAWIKPMSHASAGGFFTAELPWKLELQYYLQSYLKTAVLLSE